MIQEVVKVDWLGNDLANLPKNWLWMKLGDIARTTSGGTPSRRNPEYFTGSIPWVKSGELDDGWIYDTEEKISQEAVGKSSAKKFSQGTLLMAMYGATVGKLGILGIEAATNQAICSIFPKDFLDRDFLFYYLRSIRPTLLGQSFGGAQPNISQTVIKAIPVPVPTDINIQRRIVARIEALLAEVRSSRELLDEMRRDCDRVIETSLNEVIEKLDKEYPDSPTIEELIRDERIKMEGGGTPSRSNASYWMGTIPWVSPKDMKSWYISDAQEHISDVALWESSVKLIPTGSILTVVRGMILIRTFPVAVTQAEVTINQDMKALEPNDDFVPEYLGYILRARSPEILQKVEIAGHGTRRLKTETLNQVVIPFLDKNYQRRIVEYLNNIQSEVNRMLELMDQDAKTLDLLEQSILERAFRGEL